MLMSENLHFNSNVKCRHLISQHLYSVPWYFGRWIYNSYEDNINVIVDWEHIPSPIIRWRSLSTKWGSARSWFLWRLSGMSVECVESLSCWTVITLLSISRKEVQWASCIYTSAAIFYSGHPTITHKDYNDQYLVDTRNGRDSVPRKYKKRVKEEESDEEGSAIWEEKPAVKRKPAAKPSGLTITPLPSASKKTKDEDLWKPKGWNQGSDEEEEESPR